MPVEAGSPVPDGTPGPPAGRVEGAASIRAIARVTGASKSTAHRDVTGRDKPDSVSGLDGKLYLSEEARRMRAGLHLRLRAEGLSERAIAERSGWPRSTVHRDLTDYVIKEKN